jgi:cytochrome c
MKISKRVIGAGISLGLALTFAAADGRAAGPKIDMKAAEASMKKSDCFTCHSVKRKVVGPSYADIAKKYKGDKKAVEVLVTKVKNGGSGSWGSLPMAGHPGLKEDEIRNMVKWVLAQK